MPIHRPLQKPHRVSSVSLWYVMIIWGRGISKGNFASHITAHRRHQHGSVTKDEHCLVPETRCRSYREESKHKVSDMTANVYILLAACWVLIYQYLQYFCHSSLLIQKIDSYVKILGDNDVTTVEMLLVLGEADYLCEYGPGFGDCPHDAAQGDRDRQFIHAVSSQWWRR